MQAFIYAVLWVMTFQAGAVTGKLDSEVYQRCESGEQVNCWKRGPTQVAPVAMNDESQAKPHEDTAAKEK